MRGAADRRSERVGIPEEAQRIGRERPLSGVAAVGERRRIAQRLGERKQHRRRERRAERERGESDRARGERSATGMPGQAQREIGRRAEAHRQRSGWIAGEQRETVASGEGQRCPRHRAGAAWHRSRQALDAEQQPREREMRGGARELLEVHREERCGTEAERDRDGPGALEFHCAAVAVRAEPEQTEAQRRGPREAERPWQCEDRPRSGRERSRLPRREHRFAAARKAVPKREGSVGKSLAQHPELRWIEQRRIAEQRVRRKVACSLRRGQRERHGRHPVVRRQEGRAADQCGRERATDQQEAAERACDADHARTPRRRRGRDVRGDGGLLRQRSPQRISSAACGSSSHGAGSWPK